VLLAAEQSGWEDAATNAHSPSSNAHATKDDQKRSARGDSQNEASTGESASPDGLTHGGYGG
jgi:hypothetical protein